MSQVEVKKETRNDDPVTGRCQIIAAQTSVANSFSCQLNANDLSSGSSSCADNDEEDIKRAAGGMQAEEMTAGQIRQAEDSSQPSALQLQQPFNNGPMTSSANVIFGDRFGLNYHHHHHHAGASRNPQRATVDSSSSESQSKGQTNGEESNFFHHEYQFNATAIDNDGSIGAAAAIKSYPSENNQNTRVLQQQRQQQQQPNQEAARGQKDARDDVKHVDLFGVRIVALAINGKERLCLAQISNTLLKEFSYNEIHNRRVALGITCVQCTPVQLEMLRRAGAMPSSSRRCGMITMREAERLCRSFLVEEQPPALPENFYFTVAHRVNYGCKGRFVPARYISSRAKCIECFYCGEFYSPNKFIFHSHKQPNVSDCNPPDSPNINSWRKHIDLDWTQEHGQDIKYAWEDVKSLFNGGTRRRAPQSGPMNGTDERLSPTGSTVFNQKSLLQSKTSTTDYQDEDQEIDVEYDDALGVSKGGDNNNGDEFKINEKEISLENRAEDANFFLHQPINQQYQNPIDGRIEQSTNNNTITNNNNNIINDSSTNTSSMRVEPKHKVLSAKRSLHGIGGNQHGSNKRFGPTLTPNQRAFSRNQFGTNRIQDERSQVTAQFRQSAEIESTQNSTPIRHPNFVSQSLAVHIASANAAASGQSQLIGEYPLNRPTIHSIQHQSSTSDGSIIDGRKIPSLVPMTNSSPLASSNFIYNQLYSQLVQPQVQQRQQQGIKFQQQQLPQSPQTAEQLDAAQVALRQHLWTNLLANIQRNAAAAAIFASSSNGQTQDQTYSMRSQPSISQGAQELTLGDQCRSQLVPMVLGSDVDTPNATKFTNFNMSPTGPTQTYSNQPNQTAAATAAAATMVALNNGSSNCK